VGSQDLEQVLRNLEGQIRPLTSLDKEAQKVQLSENVINARQRFLAVLYVRLVVFRIFLSCAATQPGGLSQSHKEAWLLLQINPTHFFGIPQNKENKDKFSDLARTVGDSGPWASLLSAVELELKKTKALLGPDSNLYCVVDEAQDASRLYDSHFLSSEGHARPILRELAKIWSDMIPHLILCGTDLSIDVVETAVRSVVAKEGAPPPVTVTDLGAFDSADEQRLYVEQYLPPEFLQTESGKCLVTRLSLWLHGRYVEMFACRSVINHWPDIGLPHRTAPC
jgi:hypothetical protein